MQIVLQDGAEFGCIREGIEDLIADLGLPPLLEEDLELAQTVTDIWLPHVRPEQRQEWIEPVAKLRPMLGPSSFLIHFGLEPPRDVFDRISLDHTNEKIDDEQFARLQNEAAQQPLQHDTLRAFFDDLGVKLAWYERYCQLMFLPDASVTEGIRTHEIERIIFELQRRPSMPEIMETRILEMLVRARVASNVGPIDDGSQSASCACDHLQIVFHDATCLWQLSEQESQRIAKSLGFEWNPSFRQRFTATALAELPVTTGLHGLLKYEWAIAAEYLDKSTRSEPGRCFGDHSQSQGQQSRNPRVKPRQSGSTVAVKWQNWAIGMEYHGHWWLFHCRHGRWEQRCRVAIPGGNPEILMEFLAENDGVMSKDDAIRKLREKYLGADQRKFSSVITEALKKSRRAIRETVAEAAQLQALPDSDPIPHNQNCWRAVIHIGLAVENDDEKLEFQRQTNWTAPLRDE